MNMRCLKNCLLVLPLLLGMHLQAADDPVDKARRITGYYDKDSHIVGISVADWSPESEEARKYMGPMESGPSRRFDNPALPRAIGSLQNLEDLLYHMHRELKPYQEIHFRSAEARIQLDLWMTKVNTSNHTRCTLIEKDKKFYIYVFYNSDARVFAAFRNPELVSKLSARERDMLDVCGQWISENIQPGMPNLLKIRKIHDALVDNSKYTYGYHDAKDIVLDGRGVCSAYTAAAQLLLHMVKIDCRSVLSVSMNHIWNLIDVNGEWYHTDVTWDDPLTKDKRDLKHFGYYLLTESEMGMDHDWEMKEIYPQTPEINHVGIFKRHAHREASRNMDENTEMTPPREKESIVDVLNEKFRNEAECRGEQVQTQLLDKVLDKVEPTISPVTNPAGQATNIIARPVQNLIQNANAKKKKSKKAEYKAIQSLDDLYENLKICQDYLDGPTVEFPVQSECPCIASQLAQADYHLYLKYWNYRFDQKKRILYLDVEHWPHIRLLRSVDDADNARKLSAKERKALQRCQELVNTYGTVWKTDRQKVRDVYNALVQELAWEAGKSGVVDAFSKHRSGSLGYSEALHTALSLMKIPCIMVHGRNHDNVHAWNMVKRSNGKWYHASAAFDDEKNNTHEHTYKYFLRCDDEVMKDLVWDFDETYATPVRDKKKAKEYKLYDRTKQPAHAPRPEVEKTPVLPVV